MFQNFDDKSTYSGEKIVFRNEDIGNTKQKHYLPNILCVKCIFNSVISLAL